MAFPVGPVDGDTYTIGSNQFTYEAASTTWKLTLSGPAATIPEGTDALATAGTDAEQRTWPATSFVAGGSGLELATVESETFSTSGTLNITKTGGGWVLMTGAGGGGAGVIGTGPGFAGGAGGVGYFYLSNIADLNGANFTAGAGGGGNPTSSTNQYTASQQALTTISTGDDGGTSTLSWGGNSVTATGGTGGNWAAGTAGTSSATGITLSTQAATQAAIDAYWENYISASSNGNLVVSTALAQMGGGAAGGAVSQTGWNGSNNVGPEVGGTGADGYMQIIYEIQ